MIKDHNKINRPSIFLLLY